MVCTLDASGAFAGSFTAASSGTVTLTTTSTNDVIIVLVSAEQLIATGSPTVSSVTATGLTFTKRASQVIINSTYETDLEIWWAPASAAQSSKVITVTLTGTADACGIGAFGVAGAANINSPFDTNVSLPAVGTASAGTYEKAVTTTQAHDFIYGMIGGNGNYGSVTLVGYNQGLRQQTVTGASSTAGFQSSYVPVTTTQSAVNIGYTGPSFPSAFIVDAITSDSAATTGTSTMAFGKALFSASGTAHNLSSAAMAFGKALFSAVGKSGPYGPATMAFSKALMLGSASKLPSPGNTNYTTWWTVAP